MLACPRPNSFNPLPDPPHCITSEIICTYKKNRKTRRGEWRLGENHWVMHISLNTYEGAQKEVVKIRLTDVAKKRMGVREGSKSKGQNFTRKRLDALFRRPKRPKDKVAL